MLIMYKRLPNVLNYIAKICNMKAVMRKVSRVIMNLFELINF